MRIIVVVLLLLRLSIAISSAAADGGDDAMGEVVTQQVRDRPFFFSTQSRLDAIPIFDISGVGSVGEDDG